MAVNHQGRLACTKVAESGGESPRNKNQRKIYALYDSSADIDTATELQMKTIQFVPQTSQNFQIPSPVSWNVSQNWNVTTML